MKKILALLSVLIVLTLTGCDECVNCTPGSYCNTQEVAENVGMSECLAEDYITHYGCPNLSCFSRDPDIGNGDLRTCTVIDCQTLSCEDMRLETEPPQQGFIADISVDEETGFPTGRFEVDDVIAIFDCVIFLP